MSVEIEGLRQYIKGLENTGVEVADLKKAFSSISTIARDYAAQYAPSRFGALRKSIKGSKTKNKAVVRAGSARILYAGVTNFGWSRRSIKPSLFMQRADKKIRPQVIPLLEDAIGDILSKEFPS